MDLIKQLEKIGLSEKEAKIYSALLDAGESTANELTTRSGLNRATTYIILEKLLNEGLAARLVKKKKQVFKCENPKQILDLLQKQKEEVEVKIKIAREMLPELEMFQKVTGEKAKVRFFEGKEGSRMIQKDIIHSNPKFTDEIFNINFALKQFPVSKNDHRQAVRQKKIQGRSIVIYNPREPIPNLPLFYTEERRYLPENKNPFNAEIVLYNNKAAILSAKGEYMGIIIENKAIVDGLRFLFNLAWQGADKYLPFKTKK